MMAPPSDSVHIPPKISGVGAHGGNCEEPQKRNYRSTGGSKDSYDGILAINYRFYRAFNNHE